MHLDWQELLVLWEELVHLVFLEALERQDLLETVELQVRMVRLVLRVHKVV